jgi:hypothetical protein
VKRSGVARRASRLYGAKNPTGTSSRTPITDVNSLCSFRNLLNTSSAYHWEIPGQARDDIVGVGFFVTPIVESSQKVSVRADRFSRPVGGVKRMESRGAPRDFAGLPSRGA